MNAPEILPLRTVRLTEPALDQLFREARTHSFWQDVPVARATLEEIYDLARMGPTSANASPATCIFGWAARALPRKFAIHGRCAGAFARWMSMARKS